MKKILLFSFIFWLFTLNLPAQPQSYSTANAHSHNDYQQPIPFQMAYEEGFGSVEADIFLHNDSLLVGHTTDDLRLHRTLESLYLIPLTTQCQANNGFPFRDSAKELQLLIDIKTEPVATLRKLTGLLSAFPSLINSAKIRIVITGNRPPVNNFVDYPPFLWFDADIGRQYPAGPLTKIAMFSGDFKVFSTWNGKGNLTAVNKSFLDSIISSIHLLHKRIRFWDAPDFVNAWYQFMKLKVDYINTDHIRELSAFLANLPAVSYTNATPYKLYSPNYKSDGIKKPAKNIILLIGDGMALPQLYTGYTANHGGLNLFKIRNIGISKTSSYDSYITDSAPGATAISSGVKTNNHYVGVDHTGAPLELLPVLLARKKIKTGLVTCGDITDATPADFYAHQVDRENSRAIIRDLKNSPISILMGSGNESLENVQLLNDKNRKPFNDTIVRELEPEYRIVSNPGEISLSENRKWIVVDKQAGRSMLQGRGEWLMEAFTKSLDLLSLNKPGFFLMTEGAQIDYGGHDNNISYVATELGDFDRVVGKALEFADSNGETLVIVTADHETGGLTLLEGDYSQGFISGRFSTSDHTALPVNVFAYGPGSALFRGVYENTELYAKILKAIGQKTK